jgi:hypothetical protein
MLRQAIEDYKGWDAIPAGRQLWVGEFGGKPVGTEVGIYGYSVGTTRAGNRLPAIVFVQATVAKSASKAGQPWAAKVVSSTPLVGDNGASVPGLAAGFKISGTLQ